MRFGARVSKTPCHILNPWVQGLARCFAYACTKSHPNRSKFGGDIAQIGAHQFSLSSINFVINSTPQGPWERKDQKTRVTPYSSPQSKSSWTVALDSGQAWTSILGLTNPLLSQACHSSQSTYLVVEPLRQRLAVLRP